MHFLQVLLLLAPLANAAKVSYDGYKIFRITTQDVDGVEADLEGLSAKTLMHSAQHIDVAVPKESIPAFEALQYSSHVLNEDVGAEMRLEGELVSYSRVSTNEQGAAAIPDPSWFDAYHAYDDHLTFLSDLQASFPDNSAIFEAGASFEGRPLTGIHLWGSGGQGSRPAVYFHGTVHAREWITTMVNEYIAYQLVSGYASDPEVQGILDAYDFFIIPVVNPDGFVYTQTNDRLWRKNRQTRSGISSVGTDVNRNWPYQWEGPGSSTNPGAETYRGQQPGDTPENLGLRTLADELAAGQGLKLFVDWHSYSQLILLPYGYSCDAEVGNLDIQLSLAEGVAGAIAQSEGTTFEYGPTCSTIYQTNGGSNDYVQDVSQAEFAWAFELRDTGTYGFVLPADQIVPSGVESWDGIRWLFANLP